MKYALFPILLIAVGALVFPTFSVAQESSWGTRMAWAPLPVACSSADCTYSNCCSDCNEYQPACNNDPNCDEFGATLGGILAFNQEKGQNQTCVPFGQACTSTGPPCCAPYSCKGAWPNTKCQQ